ncbi:MAG: hypothetical protein M1832_001430 [Thelocarpon impressellum]|nr:MAG: hypothetical protein M1832_001430 [Thelocarpon impressellum]
MPTIWSKFRAGKSAADKALAKHAGVEPDPHLPPAAESYRHVPVHAQNDAIIGAPGCYKDLDRQAIKRQSRRRSQMSTPNYGTYGKSRVGSVYGGYGSEVAEKGTAMAERMTDRRMSKRIDSGFASGAASERMSLGGHSARSYVDRSGSRSPVESSQEDLPTMKRSGSRPAQRSRAAHSEAGPSASGRRATPQTIRLDNLSVCEMLHDNPNRKVGQAPRHALPVLPSFPAAGRTTAVSAATKPKKTWRLGRRSTAVAVA